MITAENTTLICPRNDLESLTIIKIAKKMKMDLRVSEQGWGGKLGFEPPETFRNLKSNVVVIELPDSPKENELREKDFNVIHIDHHIYFPQGKTLDRYKPSSSLEQFAELFHYKLTAHEKLVALNDHGYIWRMAEESSCSLEEMIQVMEDDLKAQGISEEEFSKAETDYDARVDFKSFCLVTTELERVSYIAFLHQKPDARELEAYRKNPGGNGLKVKNLLVLTLGRNKEGNERVVEINFFGDYKLKTKFDDILSDCHGHKKRFTAWTGGYDEKSFYWGGKNIDRSPVDELADAALNRLAGTQRPLLKYSTVFFYPFKFGKKQGDSSFWNKALFKLDNDLSYQEYIYFHQYARELLFQTESGHDDRSISYYEFKDGVIPEGSCLKISRLTNQEPVAYPLTHISIHEFFNNIGVLAIQVTAEIDENLMEEKRFWKQCMEMEKFRQRGLVCNKAMLFNELARKIYLSFPNQFNEGRIPDQMTLKIGNTEFSHQFEKNDFRFEKNNPVKNNIINILITDFLGYGSDYKDGRFQGILDDRMVVHTFLGFAGAKPKDKKCIEEHKALVSRIMYVDHAGEDYCYDRDFIRKEMDAFLYRRWWNFGGLYGFTRYSSAYTEFGAFAFGHFNSMYYQLTLIALYYRVFLIDFSHEVSNATGELVIAKKDKKKFKEGRQKFLDLKEIFMRFSNIYWFKEVTNQDQGIELFDFYKKTFKFKRMYEQVKEEIDRTDGFLEAKHRINLDRFTEKAGRIGLLVAGLAIVPGYFGMNLMDVPPWLSFSILVMAVIVGLMIWTKKQ